MRIESPGVRVHLRSLERWTSFVGKVSLLVGVLLLLQNPKGADPGAFTMLSFLFGPMIIAASYVIMLVGRSLPGAAEIRGDTFVVRRGRAQSTMPIRSIRSAYVVGRTFHGTPLPAVEVVTPFGHVLEIAMPDEATAHAFVDALGFGSRGRAVTIELAKRARRPMHIALGLLALLGGTFLAFCAAVFASLVLGRSSHGGGGDWILSVSFVLTAIAYAGLKRASDAPTVSVGADGLAVKRFRTERCPRSAIGGTRFARVDGPLVIDRQGAGPLVIDQVNADPAALIAVAGECARRLGDRTEVARAAAFERGSRDVREWKAAVRGALDAGYRNAGASIDDANAVLASPAATVEQRLGAAVALRIAGEPPERIRIAAQSAVDPRVRVAFEAIAEDADDVKVERALKRLG